MLVAVASGKGGTGKTLVATNLFVTLERMGQRVALVDCDAEVPNTTVFIKRKQLRQWPVQTFCPTVNRERCTFCNACAQVCNFKAITCVPPAKYIEVSAELCHGCRACTYACNSKALQTGWKDVGVVTAYGQGADYQLIETRTLEGQTTPVPSIRLGLRTARAANTKHIIVDAPPGCSCPFVNSVLPADLVLLVTEPTPFGLSDLQHSVEVLRLLRKTFMVIINRADLGDGSMQKYLNDENIEILANIPYSQQIAAYYADGKLVSQVDAQLATLFSNMAKKLLTYESSGC